MSKIYLLGHRGFIGSALLAKLQAKGHIVKTDPILHWGETFDVVINAAAKTHLQNVFDAKMIESNYILPQRVFQRSERIISLSSCSARYPETSPYAMSKVWMEHLSFQHDNSLTLRIFNVYGNGASRGIVKYLMEQPDGAKIIVRGPDLIRDYITLQDTIDFIIGYALPSTKKVYPFNNKNMPLVNSANKGLIDVGTKVGTSTMDLINLFQKISGKTFDISVVDPDKSDPAEMVAWNSKIEKFTSLEEGLKKLLNK